MSGKKNLTFKKRIGHLIRNLVILFVLSSITWVIFDRFVPIYFTPLMMIRSVESVYNGKMPVNRKKWVPINKISPNMVQAVVASEDNLFMKHHGFVFKAIEKAIKHNEKSKHLHGASTISQQTAKNVFLWPDRTYVRKAVEAYFTVLIECIWGKERIMEVYLNVIEMGKGIYGVEAASKYYFHEHAKDLTPSQAALLAACLPNPWRFSPIHPSAYIQKREMKILDLMGKIGKIDLKNKRE